MADSPSLFRVLMVCSGNTCRSPLAEAALRAALPASLAEWLDVSSCGTNAAEEAPASEGARRAAREAGLSLEEHRARRLTRRLLDEADLVLVMDAAHLDAVLRLDPAREGDASLLTAYAAGAGPRDGTPIADPYGGDFARYRETWGQIREAAEAAVRRLEARLRRDRAAPPGGRS